MQKNIKYIFIIGGVMSGIGKGIAASSVATILRHYGYKVNLMKIDPYLNVDAGTMNPTEHGEVFVLSSGLETDQDMGNYERFLNRDLSSRDYMTSGSVYQAVIERERSFKYAGKCVEAIPHVVMKYGTALKNPPDTRRAKCKLWKSAAPSAITKICCFLKPPVNASGHPERCGVLTGQLSPMPENHRRTENPPHAKRYPLAQLIRHQPLRCVRPPPKGILTKSSARKYPAPAILRLKTSSPRPMLKAFTMYR